MVSLSQNCRLAAISASPERKPGSSSPKFLRISKVEVPVDKDPGKDCYAPSQGLLQSIASVLRCNQSDLPPSACKVIRKSFDARKRAKFVYTVDMDLAQLRPNLVSKLKGKSEKLTVLERAPSDLDLSTSIGAGCSANLKGAGSRRPSVVVVGGGPAGLFASLAMAESGIAVTLVERGFPVETRGRHIGKLMVRGILHPDSNFCFGEGGAGTWSDGKLTTRIGKNSESVRTVLATLVRFGAAPNIMIDGKPHIGTDKLVVILRKMRAHLESLGVRMLFGTRMEDLVVRDGRVIGVQLCNSDKLQTIKQEFDAVVLAVGHSARDVYSTLSRHNVLLSPKDFAVGLRVEHPQELVNEMQYRELASEVKLGKVPVADYKLATTVLLSDGDYRSCYSFCMCPGGQIVPTSTDPLHLCINGMSFSKRASKWANAALVVNVSSEDVMPFRSEHGALAGVAFQKALEEEAACMGGGNFRVPAQTVPNFLEETFSGDSLPSSSYRLGVRPAALHNLLPPRLTEAVKQALERFDKQMSGFIDHRALLHGVETRTSSPVRIDRHRVTLESVTMQGLYPIGEGAGYAGGIVSAAVDGMEAAFAIVKQCK